MSTNPITQLIRHTFVSNKAPSAAWSQLPEQITDALTREYILTPKGKETPPPVRAGMHYQVVVDGINGTDTAIASTWTDDTPDTAEQHAAFHDRLAAGYHSIAAQLTRDREAAAEQDAKKQLDDKIRLEQRHEVMRRLMPEADKANNLPAWDDLDILQQRAVDQVVDLTNVIDGRATPAEVDRVALNRNAGTWDPAYLRYTTPDPDTEAPFTAAAGIKLYGTDVWL